VWIERKDDSGAADFSSQRYQLFDNPHVPAMNAVEITDRDSAVPQSGVVKIQIADQFH
jgi:hypothetical protein